MADEAVTVDINILQSSTSGTVVFTESHSVTTTAQGLYFIEISIGGTVLGTSQLLSVPYALHASTASNVFSGNYNDLSNLPLLFDGAWGSLTGTAPNVSIFTNDAGYLDAEVDGSVTNEIELPTDAGTGDMVYYDGSDWVKITAPTSNGMLLTYCDGEYIWTANGACPIEIGDRVEGGSVYYIFQDGDAGYVEGEQHGKVVSDLLTPTNVSSGEAQGVIDVYNTTSPYSNWTYPSYNELGTIRSNLMNTGGYSQSDMGTYFGSDWKWSSTSGWLYNLVYGSGTSGGVSTAQVVAIREF